MRPTVLRRSRPAALGLAAVVVAASAVGVAYGLDPGGSSTGGSRGPDATGPAAHGLCNAFSHGGLGDGSVARRNLADAAVGPHRIAAYCAAYAKDKPAKVEPGAPGKPGEPAKPGKPGKGDRHTGRPGAGGGAHMQGCGMGPAGDGFIVGAPRDPTVRT